MAVEYSFAQRGDDFVELPRHVPLAAGDQLPQQRRGAAVEPDNSAKRPARISNRS